MKKMPTYIGLYWLGQTDPIKTITVRAETPELAEVMMHKWLLRRAGKGEWGYIITEKKLSGLYNNKTEEYLVTL